MELDAARVGGDPVEQQVCVGLLLEHPVADAVQGFETVFAGDVATALLNTLLHDRDRLYHLGWWSIIGYAIAAVTAVAGFALAFRDLS
jgi:hypothetical protein